MTPDQIKAGRTYELTSGNHWTVKSFNRYGRSIIITDGEVTAFDTPHNFARYAVRDVTPAPESDQGEKVAQAQSQGASRMNGAADLTADDWPELAAAIAKLRGKPFVRRVSSAWLEGFCMGAMSMRRTPPAADAIARAEAGAPSHPRFRHRRTGDTYELLLIANEHAERTAQYPPTAVYRRVSDLTVWSRPVQDWGKDFEEVAGE